MIGISDHLQHAHKRRKYSIDCEVVINNRPNSIDFSKVVIFSIEKIHLGQYMMDAEELGWKKIQINFLTN